MQNKNQISNIKIKILWKWKKLSWKNKILIKNIIINAKKKKNIIKQSIAEKLT